METRGRPLETQHRNLIERIRTLVSNYPNPVWLMTFCNLILWTGRGMVLPFMVIYFTQITGIPGWQVGLVISLTGLAGIVWVLMVAGVIDRRGGRPVLLSCLVTIGLMTALYPWATDLTRFAAVLLIGTLASQLYWPASDATIASLIDGPRIAEGLTLLRIANAIGIGSGGLIGGMLVRDGIYEQYRTMFLVGAGMILLAGVLVWRFVPAIVLHSKSSEGRHGTWRDVWVDRTFVFAILIAFTLVLGFTQLTISVPAYMKQFADINERSIGILFTINMVMVVTMQLPLTMWLGKVHIAKPLFVAGCLWGAAFLCVMLTPRFGIGAAVAAFIVFTLGELLFMPITAIIPVRLSPEHLRGRYFSLLSVGWGSSYAMAALIGGSALDLPDPIILWPITAGVMFCGAIAGLMLGRSDRLGPLPATTSDAA